MTKHTGFLGISGAGWSFIAVLILIAIVVAAFYLDIGQTWF